MFHKRLLGGLIASAFAVSAAQAAIDLIAVGSLTQATDLSGLAGPLENGVDHGNVLGGIGSGLAWAGGSTFLALPDRGPNATSWNSAVDHTTSYISRFQTVSLSLTATPSGKPSAMTCSTTRLPTTAAVE